MSPMKDDPPFAPAVTDLGPERRSLLRLRTYTTSQILWYLGRPKMGLPDPDVEHVRLVRWAVRKLPQQVRRLLATNGWKFAAVISAEHFYHWWSGEKKKQYIESYGVAVERVAGICDCGDYVILVTEGSCSHSGPTPVHNPQKILHTVQHETGHAVDWVLGGRRNFSDSSEFRRAFETDLSEADEAVRQKFFWVKEPAAQSQTFANLFATASDRWHDSPDLEKHFPRTTGLMKQRLAQSGIELPPDESWLSGRFKEARPLLLFTLTSTIAKLKKTCEQGFDH